MLVLLRNMLLVVSIALLSSCVPGAQDDVRWGDPIGQPVVSGSSIPVLGSSAPFAGTGVHSGSTGVSVGRVPAGTAVTGDSEQTATFLQAAASSVVSCMQGDADEDGTGSKGWVAGALGQQVEDDRDPNNTEPLEEEHFALASISALQVGHPTHSDSLVKRNELIARCGVPLRLERPPRTAP